MENCIFCKIAKGEINSKKIYETEDLFAINDLHPKAPKHILLIPKKHIENFTELNDEILASKIFHAIKEIIKSEQIINYKLHVNNGAGAGQEVMHLHIHILGY